ncbi:hypothetical protein CBM2599_A10300 [Cupriavidus taiwanensis]|nr:hypothetical protein CBM2599_A10300 [Cupriavidus taiwanensis]SOY80489.1 hypothetical protein CBM2600_A10146 [Cupriavidus taiwanensis]
MWRSLPIAWQPKVPHRQGEFSAGRIAISERAKGVVEWSETVSAR